MRKTWLALILGATALFAADDPFAEGLYKQHCATCHDQGAEARIPPRAALEKMTAETILRALEAGAMREMGAKLTPSERTTLSTFLSKTVTEAPAAITNRCPASQTVNQSTNWDGWGSSGTNWRFQTAAGAGLSATDVPKLKLKWAFGIPGATSLRSQPAVHKGRVYLTGQGSLYSLDAKTGCLFWAANTPAAVRSSLIVVPGGSRDLVVFGDGGGYLRAVDAATGGPVWQVRADEHPAAVVTSTPLFYEGKLYFGVSSGEEGRAVTKGYACCTFRGSVLAVDAATGKVLWKRYMIDEEATPRPNTKKGNATRGPSGVGVWTSPTLDAEKRLLYIATGDNYSEPITKTGDAIVALALDSGKLVWSKQLTQNDAYNSSCPLPDKPNCPDADGPDFDFGASPMLVRLSGTRRVIVAGQKSGMVHGLDPDREGAILWQAKAGDGGTLGGIQWGTSTDGTRAYVALSDVRFTERTATGRKVDTTRGGGMFAFRVDNGERLWMTPPPKVCGGDRLCSPAQSQAVSAMPGVVFSGSNDGHFRAFSTADGRIVFDYDTVRDYQTVNGVPGKGGAMDAGGPVIAGGMVFVNSGYGQWAGLPGNVLLAFGKD